MARAYTSRRSSSRSGVRTQRALRRRGSSRKRTEWKRKRKRGAVVRGRSRSHSRGRSRRRRRGNNRVRRKSVVAKPEPIPDDKPDDAVDAVDAGSVGDVDGVAKPLPGGGEAPLFSAADVKVLTASLLETVTLRHVAGGALGIAVLAGVILKVSGLLSPDLFVKWTQTVTGVWASHFGQQESAVSRYIRAPLQWLYKTAFTKMPPGLTEKSSDNTAPSDAE